MFEALKDLFLKALGALLPTILGWVYKAHWIDTRLKLRVGSEGDGITVQGGELPYIRVWLQATNLSPFTVEIDRVIAQVQLRGGVIGEFVHLHKHELKPSSEELFLLEGALSSLQLAYLSRQQGGSEAVLYLTAFVNCKVHNLQLKRTVQTGNVRYLNCAP
jgi:hypothetical protein